MRGRGGLPHRVARASAGTTLSVATAMAANVAGAELPDWLGWLSGDGAWWVLAALTVITIGSTAMASKQGQRDHERTSPASDGPAQEMGEVSRSSIGGPSMGGPVDARNSTAPVFTGSVGKVSISGPAATNPSVQPRGPAARSFVPWIVVAVVAAAVLAGGTIVARAQLTGSHQAGPPSPTTTTQASAGSGSSTDQGVPGSTAAPSTGAGGLGGGGVLVPNSGGIAPRQMTTPPAGGPSTRVSNPPPARPSTTSTTRVSLDSVPSNVPSCYVFTGTAVLPSGKTLAVGAFNDSNSDPNTYYQEARDLNTAKWRAGVYFGTDDAQSYRVSVIVLDEAVASSLEQQYQQEHPGDKGAWYGANLPAGSTVFKTFTVQRVSGAGTGC